jgi:hypothetical protein
MFYGEAVFLQIIGQPAGCPDLLKTQLGIIVYLPAQLNKLLPASFYGTYY